MNQIVYKMMNMTQARWRVLFDSFVATHQEDVHYIELLTGDERLNIDQNDDGSIFLHFIGSEVEEEGHFSMEERSHHVIAMPIVAEDNDRLIRFRCRVKFDPDGLAGHNIAYGAHMILGFTIGNDSGYKTLYGLDWILDINDSPMRIIAGAFLQNATGYVYHYAPMYEENSSIVNDTWYNFEMLVNLSKVDESTGCAKISCYKDGVLVVYSEEPIKSSNILQGPNLRLSCCCRNYYTESRPLTHEFGMHIHYLSLEVL